MHPLRPPLMTVRVRGIDADGGSWVFYTARPACIVAARLLSAGWKWAALDEDGEPVGGVVLDAVTLRRVYWSSEKDWLRVFCSIF